MGKDRDLKLNTSDSASGSPRIHSWEDVTLAGVDAGIAMVEREADHFAPSIKTSILLACARAKKMEG